MQLGIIEIMIIQVPDQATDLRSFANKLGPLYHFLNIWAILFLFAKVQAVIN